MDIKETYGVPVEEIVEGIKHGVRKVNIDTDLRLASTGVMRRLMATNPSEFDPRKFFGETVKAMRGMYRPLRSLRYRWQRFEDQADLAGKHVSAVLEG